MPDEFFAPICEHLLAKNYGWSLEYIRELPRSTVMAHMQICLAHDSVEKEFEVKISGGKLS